MKVFDSLTFLVLVAGGINVGLLGLFGFNLIGYLFGEGSMMSALLFVLVGLAAVWQLFSYNWRLDVHHRRFMGSGYYGSHA